MYFENYLKKFGNKKIKIFVDMDGTIVDYVVGDVINFEGRRPLTHSISHLKNIYNNMNNVEIYILSVTRHHSGLKQKIEWILKYASFIKKENIIILVREDNDYLTAKELKANYLEKYKDEESIIIMIDDDKLVLDEIKEKNPNVILLKDTVLVD